MKTSLPVIGFVAMAAATVLCGQTSAPRATPPAAAIKQYCVVCHNQSLKTAGLVLDKLDPAHPGPDAATWEKVVRKLRAGMMPPAGMPRPDRAASEALIASLENEL